MNWEEMQQVAMKRFDSQEDYIEFAAVCSDMWSRISAVINVAADVNEEYFDLPLVQALHNLGVK